MAPRQPKSKRKSRVTNNDLSLMPNKRPHVVIIGGGFGGLEAAKTLANAAVDITLIDKTNHHLFQPLLYQVATAGLAAPAIAAPTRPATMRAARTGPSSRVIEMTTTVATAPSAWKRAKPV